MTIMNQSASTHSAKLYIAGMGSITPLGDNMAMTAAGVTAGISAYSVSESESEE